MLQTEKEEKEPKFSPKYMNPVVDQGHLCRSCWAFAATASIEGMFAIRFGEKLKLSEQQMIDCDIAWN